MQTRAFVVGALATIITTAVIGFLLLFLTSVAYYVECAQKGTSCDNSFYSVFDILVVGFSIAGIAVVGSAEAMGRTGRRSALRKISVFAVSGLVLALLYGFLSTAAYGIGIETVYYGFPFTIFVQSGVNTFTPSFVVLNYIFWFALTGLVQLLFGRLRPAFRV